MIEIRTHGLQRALASIGREGDDQAMIRLVRNLGDAVRTESRQSIESSMSPEGLPFAPLKRKRSRGRKGTTDHPLIATGEMMRGIGYRTTRTGSTGLAIVSTRGDFAVYHQSGTRTIPARPFVPSQPDWYVSRIEKLTRRWGRS